MMPTPTPGESKEAFVKRCMDDSKMLEQFNKADQRYAVCMSYAEASNDATDTLNSKHGAEAMESGQEADSRPAEAESAPGSEDFAVAESTATETVEALQYGRPGPNDPRKTPAKPSERRKGSKKNPPGSAKKPNTSIQVSKQTRARLQKMMRDHNAKGKGSRASMGALLSVFRRGAGAFSRSHAPNMGRTGWGIARVKAFLYLLRNGRPSNPNYKQDNDLLPRGHPRSKKSKSAQEVEAAEYQGRKVTLNKPFRTPKESKKFAVYVQNESGRVVIVRFGDPNMEIKRDDPQRRKNFRSRHNCDSPGPKTKARYWSCKMWERSKSVTDYTATEDEHEALADDLWFDIWSATEGEVIDGIVQAGMEDYIFSTREGAEKKSREIGFDGKTHMDRMADGTPMYFPGPDEQTFQKWFDKNDSHDASASHDACCDDCAEHASAEMIRKDVFDNPGEAANRAKEIGCEGIHSHKEGDDTIFMPCSTHEEYEKKTGDTVAMYEDEDEENVKADEEGWISHHDLEESFGVCAESMCEGCPDCAVMPVEAMDCDVCPPGFLADENGVCVAVTCELDVESFEAVLEAATGKTVIRMKGVAFTSGYNKNRWRIESKAGPAVAKKMIGADVTLNHPKIENGRFRRNMDGGVDEAVVGIVTEAKYHDDEDEEDAYAVRFTAEVHREELFAALESGLWLREGYGVSIGGTGIPTAMEEDEKGKMMMTFGSDFTFDHLAIVHKPAYPGARIESVERVALEEAEASTLMYQPEHGSVQQTTEATIMSEEITNVEASHDEAAELREALVLANARIAEFEKSQAEAAEVARVELVTKASDLGLSGHEDFSTEMLERVIASWEASRPAPREMVPATPAAPEAVAEASEAPVGEAKVASYLNGEKVESDESAYRVAWNAWASAWNGNLAATERDEMRAPMFDDLKEMI